MNSQLHPVRSALCGQDVIEYLTSYFPHARRTLFIGNLGFSPDTIFSPGLLAPLKNVDFRFLIEQRPDIPKEVNELAEACEVELRSLLNGRLVVERIAVCATDGAPVGGRNACRQAQAWITAAEYSDVVLDATGMSRGTCFPVARQLVEHGRAHGIRVHLVVADSETPVSGSIQSVSGERPDWIHGFQANVDTDEMGAALRLWVVQLKEGSGPVLNRLFTHLDTPGEVCPIVPFPSADALTGDRLLYTLRERWVDDWGESPLSLIYADESDPTDVYRSIRDLHTARQESLHGANVRFVTILSPLGRRLSSIGMFLAAEEYDLPVAYLETVGYKVNGPLVLTPRDQPDRIWCFRYHHS